MRSRKKTLLIITLAIGLLLGGGVWLAYRAARHIPEFYADTLDQQPDSARQASHQMRKRVTALASDTSRSGEWSETFTADQINGWLAVDLIEKHPDTLPEGVHDPRVSITADEARIGCQFDEPWAGVVYSIAIEPYIAEPNVVAVRFRSARAGALPMPLGRVIEEISAGAAERGVRLEWQQIDGDPVLLLPLAEDDGRYVLEAIDLADGAIRFSGQTLSRGRSPSTQNPTTTPTAKATDQSVENENLQR